MNYLCFEFCLGSVNIFCENISQTGCLKAVEKLSDLDIDNRVKFCIFQREAH